ncbi:MAG: polyprenyl synthetase family protein [bacterium]
MSDFLTEIAAIKTRIDAELINSAPLIEPRSLYEPIRYFLSIGGKRLRPTLLLFSTEAVGADRESAMDAAVAVELLHNFTLVHDDIMDHDHLRRGFPTVHRRWDESVAILAGDGLIGLAYRKLMQLPPQYLTPVSRLFTEGVIEVCEGQAFDKEFETREDINLDDYFLMIGKKTGRLMTMSTQIGAMIGGGSDEEVATLRDYGALIGKAFQIQDDLLDIASSEEIIGKTFGSDLIAGKKTYLMIKALELTGMKRQRIADILHTPKIDQELLLEIRRIFREARIFEQTERAIQTTFQEADQILDSFPHPESVKKLRDFTTLLLNRSY